MKTTIISLPGWGFHSNIFNKLNHPTLSFIGMDYYQYNVTSLKQLANKVSESIPNNSSVLGWSFGGVLASTIAALFPNKIDRIIWVASQPQLLRSPKWQGISLTAAKIFIQRFEKNPRKQLLAFTRLAAFPDPSHENTKQLKNHLIQGHEKKLALHLKWFLFHLPYAHSIEDQKSLFCISTHDRVLTQTKKCIYSHFPNSHVINLKKQGHSGLIHSPELYYNAIESFVAQ